MLASAPGYSTASNKDSVACAIACPQHGLGLARSFC